MIVLSCFSDHNFYLFSGNKSFENFKPITQPLLHSLSNVLQESSVTCVYNYHYLHVLKRWEVSRSDPPQSGQRPKIPFICAKRVVAFLRMRKTGPLAESQANREYYIIACACWHEKRMLERSVTANSELQGFVGTTKCIKRALWCVFP